MRRTTTIALVAGLLSTSCSSGGEDQRTIVASFYPLAYAAERIAGPGWNVIDLTPPGTEAHDVELSFDQRAAIEEADVVLYMGDIGFQPQVEAAVDEAVGTVVDVTQGLRVDGRPVSAASDPHVWLDPLLFGDVIARAAIGMEAVDPSAPDRVVSADDDLERLHSSFRTGLRSCRFRTLIASHEAFGYLTSRYGLEEFGLVGLAPEGEPTATRREEAERLIEDGRAGAVFYESTAEGMRIGETVAHDAGVPALPLSTLESQPAGGDYMTVMEQNLDSLREGLGCR